MRTTFRLLIAFLLAEVSPTAAQLATLLPADAPHRNVRDYGAVGDGVADDTQAFLDALEDTYNAWEQVYVPPGTYLLSDQIRWNRFITLRGAGPERTTLRLRDGAAGFADRDAPRAVLYCRRYSSDGHDNVSHSNFIFNLTLDTGADNPGAIGIDFNSHNGGGVSNVRVVDGGNSLTGISLEREAPGPSLISDVEVVGFDTGIKTRWGVYSMTFERIRLLGQRVTGFYNGEHNATIRDLYSDNAVPAITVADRRAYGLLVLLDAELVGGARDAAAVVGGGELFVRNLTTAGYGASVRNGEVELAGPTIGEYVTSAIVDEAGATTGSLGLDHPRKPIVPVQDTSQWTNVRAYSELRGDNGDWSVAFQAAVDEGATTLYFPNFTNARYQIDRDVILRGDLERVVGLSARFQGGGRLITENTGTLVMDQVRVDDGIVHRGSGPLVITHAMGGRITTAPGAGDLFVQDWCCGSLRLNGSRAYFSQFNNESPDDPKIVNDGGELVVVNLKTELPSRIAHTLGGGRTEVLGGLLYPSQTERPTEPAYRCDDCDFSALHRIGAAGYPGFLILDGRRVDPDFEEGPRFVTRRAASAAAELEADLAWRVSPNPADATVRIGLATEPHERKLSLIDALGRLLKRVVVPAGASEIRLDVSAYPAGLYALTLSSAGGVGPASRPFAIAR